MTLFKRTLHWTGAMALAGVMSASFLAPSTALAEERDSFKLAWTIYAGWMPWAYGVEQGIIQKWADKYDIDIEVAHKEQVAGRDDDRGLQKAGLSWHPDGSVLAVPGRTTVVLLKRPAAHKVAWGWTAGIALLYPFNAKFSVLGDYPCKYPMHYVPEALMLSLSLAGLYLTLKN